MLDWKRVLLVVLRYMEGEKSMKEQKWINLAKALAIFAVVIDHTAGYLYTNPVIQRLSFFSVPLFIMVSGMTSYLANIKYGCEGPWYHIWFRSSKKILAAYFVSTAIIQVYQTQYFDLMVYLQHIIQFDIARPYYFIPIYLQLMLVNSLLFRYLETPVDSKVYIYRIVVMGCVVTAISYCTSIHTSAFTSLHGGAKYMLGGSYLLTYYIGMLLSKHQVIEKIGTIKNRIIIPVLILLCGLWYIESSQSFPVSYRFLFGTSYNPPNIAQMLFSIVLLVVCIKVYEIGTKYKIISYVVEGVQSIGKISLFIFLYHLMFVEIAIQYVPTNSIWLRRLVCLIFVVLGSLLLSKVFFYIKKFTSSDENDLKQYYPKVSVVLLCLSLIYLLPNQWRAFQMTKGSIYESNSLYTVIPEETVWSCEEVIIPNGAGGTVVGMIPEDETRVIESNTMYKISFDLSCDVAPELLYLDMNGVNYDPVELNFFFDIVEGKHHYSVIFEAGYVPEDAKLRWIGITNDSYILENFTVATVRKQFKTPAELLSSLFN